MAECRARNLPFHLIDATYDAGEWNIAPLTGDGIREAAQLFRETVRAVASRDYAPEQVDAWAPGDRASLDAIAAKLARERTVGVRECGILVGFGSLDDAGDIDMLYVHKDRQRQGIARRILRELEAMSAAQGKQIARVDASLTARPFFERMGYTVVREQTVERRGTRLVNFRMEKRMLP